MRSTPSRRDRWKGRVLATPTLSHGTRLFLVHILAKHMKADGYVSQPRQKLADAADVSERQVTRYMSNAVNAGWLVVMQPGYRSMTAEYQATFPSPESGTQDVSHYSDGKRDANRPPLGVTNTSRITPRKRDVGRPTTSSTTTTGYGTFAARPSATHSPNRPRTRSSLRFCFQLSTHRRKQTRNLSGPNRSQMSGTARTARRPLDGRVSAPRFGQPHIPSCRATTDRARVHAARNVPETRAAALAQARATVRATTNPHPEETR